MAIKNKPKCEVRGTIQHFIKYRWKELNRRTVNGTQSKRLDRYENSGYKKKAIRLEITKAEFKEWCYSNLQIIQNLYSLGLTPSIDRIDNSRNYSRDNMQILEVRANKAKRY